MKECRNCARNRRGECDLPWTWLKVDGRQRNRDPCGMWLQAPWESA